jgi:voltage-gated potassium channel
MKNKTLIYDRLKRRVIELFIVVTLVAIVGTMGYMQIEKVSLNDALYMTVITLSAVGFKEVFTLSALGRLWTAGLIVMGISFVGVWVAIVSAFMFETDFSLTQWLIRRNKK